MLEEVRALCLRPEIEKQRILTVMIESLDVCLRNYFGWLYPVLHAHETKKTRRNNCSAAGRLIRHLVSMHKGRHLLALLILVSSSFSGSVILYLIPPLPCPSIV